MAAARNALNNSKKHIVFTFMDLIHHNNDLASLIYHEFYKYEPIINEALTLYMQEFEKEFVASDNRREDETRDTYECSFDDGYKDVADLSVRGLKCNSLGRLITLRGTVTRTSEVRP